ncbi:MAG TPA: endonuclease/exonuclease/phosphatase family protein [Bryobacteraceae bacterium]
MKYWLFACGLTLLGVFVLAGRPAPGNLPNLPNLQPAASGGTISVASLNLDHETSFEKILHDIDAAPRLRSADILLLQEVAHQDGGPSIASRLADSLGYSVAFSPESPTVLDRGLAVVSKFPIEDSKVEWLTPYNLRFKTRHRFALEVNIRAPSGELHIWNAHLDTRINPDQRLGQLQPVMDEAAKMTGARLIGGDFNTNDFYWIGHVLPIPHGGGYRTAVRRSMARIGFQTPFKDELITLPLIRQHLDWLFVNGLEPLDSSAEPIHFSDHNAIWAAFRVMQ